ncbi:hypothetical protein HanIR_Chr02g0083611 [Helianthus annuus]|nr:hypothetical protein HanIR_Chr02g0083611 [Helianthus annuus]
MDPFLSVVARAFTGHSIILFLRDIISGFSCSDRCQTWSKNRFLKDAPNNDSSLSVYEEKPVGERHLIFLNEYFWDFPMCQPSLKDRYQ